MLTFKQVAAASAITALLSAIFFPLSKQASAQNPHSEKQVLRKLVAAALVYGSDYDDQIVISLSGAWRDLQNVRDGELTTTGNERADTWASLLVPHYLADRNLLLDPRRPDTYGIFAGPPLAEGDAGFDVNGATFRNQNRFPFYGLNYEFLSPLRIPADKLAEVNAADYAQGEARSLLEAQDPGDTVFFTPSKRWEMDAPAYDRGQFTANAPGMWNVLVRDEGPYIVMWGGTDCSGDWCGLDVDPNVVGVQTSQSSTYVPTGDRAANVAMLDGHVRFLSLAKLTAGTNYFDAAPNDDATSGLFGGGAVITDRSKHIWNLNSEFFDPPSP